MTLKLNRSIPRIHLFVLLFSFIIACFFVFTGTAIHSLSDSFIVPATVHILKSLLVGTATIYLPFLLISIAHSKLFILRSWWAKHLCAAVSGALYPALVAAIVNAIGVFGFAWRPNSVSHHSAVHDDFFAWPLLIAALTWPIFYVLFLQYINFRLRVQKPSKTNSA